MALCLWSKLDRTLRLAELTEEVSRAVDKLTERQLDRETAAHLVGSGTLLVRDETGLFAFVHQSVMEWLVANHAASQLDSRTVPNVLWKQDMSPLMADFFCDLAGREKAQNWASFTVGLSDAVAEQSRAKANALLVLGRLGEEVGRAASVVSNK